MTRPETVDIREVGPRDGLQVEAPVDPADRVRLVEALVEAGVSHVEACAFVSPAAVPAMAGAGDVMAKVSRVPGVTYTALVPNRKGAELALEAGVDELTVTVSASPAYSEKNVRMSIDESVAAAEEICARAGPVPVDAVISCAFGSPYEGDIAPERAAALGVVSGIDLGRLLAAGALAAELVGHPLASRVSVAGPRDRLTPE